MEEAFASLLAFGQGTAPDGDGLLARMLAEDLDALAFVRFPQFPSSRAFGDAPAVTTWEYRALIPNDPAHGADRAGPAAPVPAKRCAIPT